MRESGDVREQIAGRCTADEHGDGVRVLRAAEEAAPAYLAELQEDYEAIQRDEVELSSGEEMVEELRELGLNV